MKNAENWKIGMNEGNRKEEDKLNREKRKDFVSEIQNTLKKKGEAIVEKS